MKKTLQKMKNDNGITLIALVITIIVLLILAGVTIATLTGDNGLLNKAKSAVDKYSEGEIEEKIKLGYQQYQMNNVTGQSESLQNILSNMGLSVNSIDKIEGEEIYEIVIQFNNNEDSYILKNGKVNKSNLPKGYKECEYIETSGIQYINTNIQFDDTTEFYLKCSFNTTNQQWNGIGHDDTNRFMMGILNNKFSAALGNIKSSDITADNKVHEFLLSNKDLKFSIDDVKINFENKARIWDGKEVIGIGARLSGNFYYCNEKIYNAKIYKNNKIVLDLIPCLDNNNEACMYDTVTKNTFYNGGSGNFAYVIKNY